MKAILMSIQSKWLAKILNSEKTVELRKRFPKDYRGWVYLYCTKAKPYLIKFFGRHFITYYLDPEVKDDGLVKNGLVVARVWVDNVERVSLYPDYSFGTPTLNQNELMEKAKITKDEFYKYFPQTECGFYYGTSCFWKGFAIYFSKLEIFGKPKELGEFYYYIYYGMDCPPYFYEVKSKTQVRKAPQSWQYVEVEE